MIKELVITFALAIPTALTAQNAASAAGHFSIKGHVPGLKAGVVIGLLSEEGDRSEITTATVKEDGSFSLEGSIERPTLCTLTTNNLDMLKDEVEKENYSHVKWTYTTCFVSPTVMTINVSNYNLIPEKPVSDQFSITGGDAQNDFNTYNLMLQKAESDNPMDDNGNFAKPGPTPKQLTDSLFVSAHPTSVVSYWIANNMLEDGYTLTRQQLAYLKQHLTACPEDTARYSLFISRLATAERTAKGNPVIDLPLLDTKGNACQLVNVIPKGKLVLVDFWASWCGICRAANPTIKELVKKYPDTFRVISVSSDEKDDAWRKAMQQEDCPWPQYVLTKQGYTDFFTKYQTHAVPYFLLVSPDGTALCSPGGIREVVEQVEIILNS